MVHLMPHLDVILIESGVLVYLQLQVMDLNFIFYMLHDAVVVDKTDHQHAHHNHYKILIMREVVPYYTQSSAH